MKYLLDTSILIWTFENDHRIDSIRDEVVNPNNEVYFSAASIWEIAIKNAKGKLSLTPDDALNGCAVQSFAELSITSLHSKEVKNLRYPDEYSPHKDPFDNILVSQAKCEGLILLTSDVVLSRYLEPCIMLVK